MKNYRAVTLLRSRQRLKFRIRYLSYTKSNLGMIKSFIICRGNSNNKPNNCSNTLNKILFSNLIWTRGRHTRRRLWGIRQMRMDLNIIRSHQLQIAKNLHCLLQVILEGPMPSTMLVPERATINVNTAKVLGKLQASKVSVIDKHTPVRVLEQIIILTHMQTPKSAPAAVALQDTLPIKLL